MKYVSIDIETLGLNSSYCDVVEFGAVIDDLKNPTGALPKFQRYFFPPEGRGYYRGEPTALAMNSEIIKKIVRPSELDKILFPHQLGLHFSEWLMDCGYEHNENGLIEIVVAGKNFATFDWKFIAKLGNFDRYIRIDRRVIDPAMLYFNPKKDLRLPSLDLCLKRAGIDKCMEHDSISDAMDVIHCLRYKWKVLF